MDWKQFFASVIGSAAWPATILALATLFRKQLIGLIERIKKFGAAGLNLEITEAVENAVSAGNHVQTDEGVAAPAATQLDENLLRLVEISPEAGLLFAFKELETRIIALRAKLPDGRPHRTLAEVLKALQKDGQIPASALALFQNLRAARNAAAHESDERKLTSTEAIELIRQIKLLEAILPQPN